MAEMKRFTRTPYYSGPDDPEIGQPRGPIELGETVIIETVGGHDQDYEGKHDHRAGAFMEVLEPRHSRQGGPFYINGVKPSDWIAINIIDIEVGPYGFYRNGGPHWGSMRMVAPVRDGLVHFPPDFVVPVRPMIGYIELAPLAMPGLNQIEHGGNTDFNSYQAGSTVHIQAQKTGGLMTLTDVHARMGDGELTGTGVEIDSAITLRVDLSPGFPCHSPVVEKGQRVEPEEEWLTSGKAADWEGALKIAWAEMVALICHEYDTSTEHANLIVGTIADARPGYAAGQLNSRGVFKDSAYVTCQLAVTRELRRTGQPFEG